MVGVAAFTGHEDEFRALFAQEAETRLTRLARELIELEEAGPDEELVASIFRDAHTLKGAAGVVGLDEVARAAHAMEEVLEHLRSGARLPTRPLVDALLGAVDLLRDLVARSLAGEDVAGGAARVGQALAGADEPAAPSLPAPVDPPSPAAAPAPGRARPEAETVRLAVDRLDELARLVGEAAAANLRVGRVLAERLGVEPATVPEHRELSRLLGELQERAMQARMVPIATVVEPLRRAVRDLGAALGKRVRWEMRGEDTELDRHVLERLGDALLQLVRNAVDHGIEPPEERRAAGKPEEGSVRVHAMQLGSEVIVAVTDDGRGVDVGRVREAAARLGHAVDGRHEDALYAIFRSGLSTAGFVTDVSGRGVGLDVVRAGLDAVRGRVEVDSRPGQGSEFRIAVPVTLSVLPCLLVSASGQSFALPMHSVVAALRPEDGEQAVLEGVPALWAGAGAPPLSALGAVLGLGPARADGPVVVLASLTRRHAFRVDELIGQREVVVKGLGRLVPRVDVFTGASVEPDGSVMLVLDPTGLIERARRLGDRGVAARLAPVPAARTTAPRTILVVDDALTVRELQRTILERAGYDVWVAADGAEALALLADRRPDLVLTDVQMPNVDGFALTEAIRADERLAGLPVLMLTTRTGEDDRRRGMAVGADGYIVKHAFDEAALLAAVERLLAGAS